MELRAPRRYMLFIASILAAFSLAVIISPLTLPTGSVPDLDGSIGVVDNWERLRDVPWLQKAVYLIGDVNCHQQAERSFQVNGNQMPFCARDLGIMMGAAAGTMLFMLRGRRAHWELLLLILMPMALDGGLQALTSYESDNAIRLATGAMAGLAVGWGAGALVLNFFERREEGNAVPEGDGQA